jgi:hypothetical protein
MGMMGAKEKGMGLTGTINVIGVMAFAGQKSKIFFANNRCANTCLNHHSLP